MYGKAGNRYRVHGTGCTEVNARFAYRSCTVYRAPRIGAALVVSPPLVPGNQ
jgi:hypothetical protein